MLIMMRTTTMRIRTILIMLMPMNVNEIDDAAADDNDH